MTEPLSANCPGCGGRLQLHVTNRLAGFKVYRCEDCTARIEFHDHLANQPPKETP